MKEKTLILDDIRSVNNTGAIFRTADAIGIDKIYLCGTTPTPVDRFGRERNDFKKTALGAEKSVDWEYRESSIDLIDELQKNGFQIISLEQDKKSVDYKDVEKSLCDKVTIVLGNEVDGVKKEVLKKSDLILEIPMRGEKESLNVSVSAGILLYKLFDK